MKLLPPHAVRDGASLSNDFAAIMQKLGTTGDYPYVGGYLAKISSGTGYTSAWAELRVGYTIFVPLKPTLWSMKVAGADIAIRNGEILQVPAMDERQTLKQPHEPGAGSASTTQSPYMGQLLKTGLFSLFSAPLVPFATFH